MAQDKKKKTDVVFERDGDTLVIKIPMSQDPQPSRSTGKTLVVASTGGNIPTGIRVQGKELIVGVNGYIKP